MKRAIEESFPIVEINRLAVPERNAFKPIYQMHKWFARRASCVFRAILLASMKPAGTDIMEEFYQDHTDDPDTNGVTILDPFMGGGTTVVEALRLGCHVTGIDLNPVAWFIVKTEVEPVDIDELKDTFQRLENRMTASGKPLREELLSHYKTECPCCGAGRDNADIIYTFWVKSAICTNPTCNKEVPLFGDYIIAQKSPTIRYLKDYPCSACKKEIDIDLDPASLVAETSLSVNNTKAASGDLRSNKRWTLYDEDEDRFTCPWCGKEHRDTRIRMGMKAKKLSTTKKKVPLSVLLCPNCQSVWQYRGTLPGDVVCPACKKAYSPNTANIASKGDFVCPSCGQKDSVINSIRKLPLDKLLPVMPYAIEGYCPTCAGDSDEVDLLGEKVKKAKNTDHRCNIKKNNGKFFKRINPADLKRYQGAETRWEREKESLPYPKGEVPLGEKTKSGLIAHHYKYWHQMFNPRQLLCLSTLLKAIDKEEDQVLKEMCLTAFFTCLEANNMFSRYDTSRYLVAGVFARHDFQPKSTICENNVYGVNAGARAFNNNIPKFIEGKKFNHIPFDRVVIGNALKKADSKERIAVSSESSILCQNSVQMTNKSRFSFVITDPPYAGNVNYSELADFFYVWLRLVLSKTYSHFAPEITPKADEIVENPTRGKTAEDYEEGLTQVWKKCHGILDDNGLVIFTFHHAEGSTWESLLESICNAGFAIEAVYPIHSEAENSLHLMDKEAISYDLIHVCGKRNGNGETKKRSWAGIRQEIRRKARDEIQKIEAGRYGSEKLSPADINIILIGKCLELYSKHYGSIVDHKDEVVPLKDTLTSIRMMVEQLMTTQQPLPSELEHIDPVSYVYLTCLCDRKEIQSDEVNKATKGILEVDALKKAGIMRKGRAKRGRTYEVKHPDERYDDLQELFKKKKKAYNMDFLFPEMEEEKFDNVALVDTLHYLMGLADRSENLVPWLHEFQRVMPQLRVALEYLKGRNPTFQEPISKILNILEV